MDCPRPSFAIDKAAILEWLAHVHRRRESLRLSYPDAPLLGEFLKCSNEFHSSDSTYSEVISIGDASGVHLLDYVAQQPTPPARPGCCPFHPIVIDGDSDEEVSSDDINSPPSEFFSASSAEVCSGQDSCDGIGSEAVQ